MVPAAAAEESLALLPPGFTLFGPAARQQLVVERVQDGQFVGQCGEGVTLSSSDEKVVRIEGDVALPVANGTATLTATFDGRTACAQVTVADVDQPFTWSFRNHVQSVLSKAGCNSGACHGALAGKKGFHLSLRGYDPLGDYLTLTREARGRRIIPSDPGRSLILTKPTGLIPHGGGLRLELNSREYQVLAEWIAAGTPPPADSDARVERLEILPAESTQAPEMTQQLLVRAHFTDGHVEDVTRWCKYTATNLPVAEVNDEGTVRVMASGEGAITAWYLSKVVTATVTAPFEQEVDPAIFERAERRNFIDESVLAKLRRLNVPPSPPVGDAEFIRRLFLDTIGVLPTADETRAFLADTAADKRDRLIETLLERPEFVDYWSYKWSDLLLVNSETLPPAAMWSYYNWIRNNVAANTPWDALARGIVTAIGSTLENGATNFYLLHQDPRDLAETTSLAFLGMSINCARCHNHPLEKWSNDQYYAMANLFARVRTKNLTNDANRMVYCASEGDLVQPLSGKAQSPQPLEGKVLPIESPEDRRLPLADWLTSPENPYFSRAIANRVWANFLGVGLVENVDDMRQTNPASNEPLLSELAAFLVDHRYDLKALMRVILQSGTYQRSSEVLEGNRADERFYSRYYARRMMAEVLLDAYSQVTAAPTKLGDYPVGWRALQLPDSNVDSYFLKTFGRPQRIITCECERTAEPSMVQVLHIANGDTLNTKLATDGNRLDKWLSSGLSDEQWIDEAYLTAYSRFPTKDERARIVTEIASAGETPKRVLMEDVLWSLLSSKEFLFHH